MIKLYLLLLLLFICNVYGLNRPHRHKRYSDDCLPAPYLYITYHGSHNNDANIYNKNSDSINNIQKYSRDGCYMGNVLISNEDHIDPIERIEEELKWSNKLYRQYDYYKELNLEELRGMILLPDGRLLVNNGYKHDSRVILFNKCDENGQRSFIKNFVTTNNSSGLVHPYGITINNDGSSVFVSNQDSNCVLRFHGLDGTPQELSTHLAQNCWINPKRKYNDKNSRNGCFVGDYIDFPVDDQPGVRGIAFAQVGKDAILFVANEYLNAVLAYEGKSVGVKIGSISLDTPIGVYYHNDTQILYAGSKGGNKVVAIDVHQLSIIKEYTHDKMTHPAGLVVYEDTLFVLGQNAGHIFQFNTTTTEYLGHLSPDDDDDLEQIMLSPC